MPNDAFAAFVLRRIRERGLSRQQFCRMAGISRSAFYKLISQQVKEVRLDTLAKIAKTLNVNLFDLIALALGLPENGSHPPERPGK